MSQRRWTPRVSISFKLIGFTAIAVAAITGILSWYFQAEHVDALVAEQHGRAQIYGDLLANGLRSAVAFSDRETAREVLTPLAADPDVTSTTLYGDAGAVLYTSGVASSWVERARAGVRERRVADLRNRVAIITPVTSLEGPRGTLVIELSKERLAAQQRAVQRTAFAVGLAALAFGVLAAWWIARSLALRLRAIGRVATAVTAGSLEHEGAKVDSADEIGVLAGAFNGMLVQLRDANRRLESRVEQRTSQLRETNAQLQSEMERRLAMELELRQAQKLESVGRLAAGIAHEINTPVQFVADSSWFLGEATAEMIAGFDARRLLLEQLRLGEITVADAIAQIEESDDAHDVGYLIQQVPLAVERVKQGCARVAKIVGAMKEFAFADQSAQSAADINRAIESTLVVASNEYKYVAEIVTELGELPPVVCHLSELNQVVLNIVVNAAHAIESVVTGTDKRGTIRITTSVEGDQAVIAISDDGCGIPGEILDKVFDPFFTTKEIGKGTGQGLAIARSVVVDKHRGRLTVTSTPRTGTTFTIQLPIAGIAEHALPVREAA